MIIRGIRVWSAFACLAFIYAGVPVQAGIVYMQATDIGDPTSLPTASQNDTSAGGLGNFATVYDNFTLGASAGITGVDWTGSYASGTFAGNPQGSIAAFTLTFWANDVSVPGGQPDTTNPALAQFNTTAFSETSLGNDVGGDAAFTYHVDIPTFNAAAGAQYWLSTVPDLAFPIQWGWQSATVGGDGNSYQDNFGFPGQLSSDFAFTLNASGTAAIPEPASLTLLALGFGCCAARGWLTGHRRRKGSPATAAQIL